MTPEERQEIREWARYHADTKFARLLADYDRLVEVARDALAAFAELDAYATWSALGRPEVLPFRMMMLALRDVIDPATPEPVEGEPT